MYMAQSISCKKKIVLPVNGTKHIEIMHHNPVYIPEAIHFPERVETRRTILPQSRNLTEGQDGRVVLSDSRYSSRVVLPDLWLVLKCGQTLSQTGPQTPEVHHTLSLPLSRKGEIICCGKQLFALI